MSRVHVPLLQCAPFPSPFPFIPAYTKSHHIACASIWKNQENRIDNLARTGRHGLIRQGGGLAAVAAIEAVETAFAGFTAEPAAAECGQTSIR